MLYLTIFFTFDAIFLSDSTHNHEFRGQEKKWAKSMQPATQEPKKSRLHLRLQPLFLLWGYFDLVTLINSI
jgi:hypothetical protein